MTLFGVKRGNPRAEFMKAVRAVDKALVASGAFPDSILTPWWTETLERFFASTATTLVVRAGRQSRKSTVACLATVAWALYGTWKVPRGAVAIIPFLSVDRGEAAERIRTIGLMLDALGVAHARRGDEVELKDRNVIFRVYAASVRTVGMTAVAIVADEVAKWRDEETLQNPAREVFASVKPATVTQVPFGAFVLAFSSPLTEQDFHAELVRAGDTDAQLVFAAATWVANPSVTEETTRALEPDERVWSREYLAEPSAGISAAFPDGHARHVSKGVRRRPRDHSATHGIAFDLGDGKSWCCFLVFHYEYHAVGDVTRRRLVVDELVTLKPGILRRAVKLEEIRKTFVRLVREYQVESRWMTGDRYRFTDLGEQLQQDGIRLPEKPAGMTLRDQARRSQALMDFDRGDALDLLDVDDLLRPLGNAVVRPSGTFFIITTQSKRTQPDDPLDCLLLSADPEQFGKMPASGRSGVRLINEIVSVYPPRLVNRWVRDVGNGQVVPCAPPVGSREYRAETARRWTKGVFEPHELEGRTIDELMLEGARTLDELEG